MQDKKENQEALIQYRIVVEYKCIVTGTWKTTKELRIQRPNSKTNEAHAHHTQIKEIDN